MLACAVAGVARGELAADLIDVGAELARAAARALVLTGRQEDLQPRVGRDDGADVAALGDPVAGREQGALAIEQRRAHLREGGDARGLRGDGRASDRARHVAAAE
jgi:hypothetical protein